MSVSDVPVVIVDAKPGTARNGKPFARYTLRDAGASFASVRWDHQLADDEAGCVALASGEVSTYDGKPQITLSRLDVLDEPGRDLLARLRPASDPGLHKRLVKILEAAHASLPPVCWSLFREALGADPFDLDGPFWTYAAAQSKHHAGPGGLAWHVLTMLAHVDALAPHYPGLDVDLLKVAVLTHDLGKLDCYEMNLFGARRLPLDRLVGHTSYSIARVLSAIARLRARGLTITAADEENLLHAIGAHHGRMEWGATSEPQTPEAAAMHALDLLDAHIRGGLDERKQPPPDRRGTAAAPRDRGGQPAQGSLF